MGRYSDEVVRQGEAFADSQDMGALAVLREAKDALEKAEAGICDWRLGRRMADSYEWRHMTAAEPYLYSVRSEIRAALAKADALLSRSGVRPSAPATAMEFEGHTPQPWVATTDGWISTVLPNLDKLRIAKVAKVPNADAHGGFAGDEVTAANARLIAAAPAIPSLLSALRPIASAYLDDPGTSDLDDEQPVTITLGDVRRARAALREVEESR